MKVSKITKIKEEAKRLNSSGKNWHFHILTPECQLNETDKYALILENIADGESLVCYSDKPYMDVGKELVKLLHGSGVVKKMGEEVKSKPSCQVEKFLKRAKRLNSQGKNWHHHMLFPGCVYNIPSDYPRVINPGL